MGAEPSVTASGDKTWINRHETFTQEVDAIYTIQNGDSGNLLNDYNATAQAVAGLIGKATAEKKSLRALGGCWSFSDIAATDGWLVNTMGMNILFNITPGSISDEYTGNRDQLLLAQCGNSVQELNRYLESHGKSLKTSGASNGQTIAGAIATGTHGAAFNFGATQDFVAGLHLIVSATQQIWLERASYPVISETLAAKLNVKIMRDNDMFNAALVGLGSFGFVHGVLIETEEKYLLEGYRQLIPYDDTLKTLMQTLDFNNSPLPHGSEMPFHFQVVINQHDLDAGAYVTTMYKRPYSAGYVPPSTDPGIAGPGDDAPTYIGLLTDLASLAIPLLVNTLIRGQLKPGNWTGTSGEIFSNTNTRGKVLSTAIGIPISYITGVNEILFKLNNTSPFPGIFAYRFVKQSQATLAFTRFNPTCVVELDGVQSEITWSFYKNFWNELMVRDIPHTFHWGKVHNLDSQKVRKLFQTESLQWIKARNTILPPDSRAVFSSPPLKHLGLD